MLNISVQGGTNAGNKKPYKGVAPDWKCACGKNPGFLKKCHKCEQERP